MSRGDYPGPKLPSDLLEKVGGGSRRNGFQSRQRHAALGRKAQRKAQRVEKRQAPRKQMIRRSASLGKGDEQSLDEGSDADLPSDVETLPAFKAKSDKPKSILKKREQPTEREHFAEDDLPAEVPRHVRKKLEEEDAEIAALERKLGVNGKKKKSKSLDDDIEFDALDHILDGLSDGEDNDDWVTGSASKRKRDEDDEWLENKRQKAEQKEHRSAKKGVNSAAKTKPRPSPGTISDTTSDDESDEYDYFSDSDEDLDNNISESEEDDGVSDDFAQFDSDALDESDGDGRGTTTRLKENPYIAPVAEGTVVQKYIPPSMRALPASDAEALGRLKRQIQGLLNRLSEANILSILKEVEKLYQTNPRQYVTTSIIEALLAAICDRSLLLDTFMILHAGFIAAIYKVIGTDFGAQVVEKVVENFDMFYAGVKGAQSEGKEANNLMSLMAEMYNLQVIGSDLVFDYLRLFLSELSDLNTELILRVVRLAGQQLRSDDPSSLKDIVGLLQQSISLAGEQFLPVRTRFMVETINNLKNNRMKTGAAASAMATEHTTRMKKSLGSLNERSIKASEPLRISLKDIRNTDKRGKWWLVGASWKGNDRASSPVPANLASTRTTSKLESDDEEEILAGTTDLMELAKSHKMNTDIRRAVFMTIMSSSDAEDAYLRLSRLRLKKAQEQEIPRVLVHCAGCELSYNPYYMLLARRLCGDRKVRMTFQFTLWDKLKKLSDSDDAEVNDPESSDEMSMRNVVNLARMFGGLFGHGFLPLACLKVVEFTRPEPKLKAFLEVLFVTLILQTQQRRTAPNHDKDSLLAVFKSVEQAPQMVRGLQYFLNKVVSKANIAATKKENKVVQWACERVGVYLTPLASVQPSAP